MIKKKKKKMTDEEIVIRRKELAKKEKVAATLDCCSDRRKSVGPSAPIAYATSVSPPDEAVVWPWTQVLGAGYGCCLAGVEVSDGKLCYWLSVAEFLQITAHASKMQIPHNQIISFYSCARWHQFELTEHGAQS